MFFVLKLYRRHDQTKVYCTTSIEYVPFHCQFFYCCKMALISTANGVSKMLERQQRQLRQFNYLLTYNLDLQCLQSLNNFSSSYKIWFDYTLYPKQFTAVFVHLFECICFYKVNECNDDKNISESCVI